MSTLRTFNLTKSYGGRTVVRGVKSRRRIAGRLSASLDRTARAKTTTFYMTVGLTPPDSGRVELDGQDVTDDPMYIRATEGHRVFAAGSHRSSAASPSSRICSPSSRRCRSIRRRAARGCASCSRS